MSVMPLELNSVYQTYLAKFTGEIGRDAVKNGIPCTHVLMVLLDKPLHEILQDLLLGYILDTQLDGQLLSEGKLRVLPALTGWVHPGRLQVSFLLLLCLVGSRREIIITHLSIPFILLICKL